MATKGALPLLLLGGAALFMMSSKKKSAGLVVDGMKLHGDCQGITTVNLGDWMNSWIAFWKVNGLEAKVDTAEDLEAAFAGRLQEMFPQCTWPPGDAFEINGMSWSQAIVVIHEDLVAIREAEEKRAAKEAAGEPIDATVSVGVTIGRALGGY